MGSEVFMQYLPTAVDLLQNGCAAPPAGHGLAIDDTLPVKVVDTASHGP